MEGGIDDGGYEDRGAVKVEFPTVEKLPTIEL